MYKPEYSITNNILSSVSKIEAAKVVIENAQLIPNWERRFQEDAINRQVHHSTAIEENPLNFTEVKNILAGKELAPVRKRDVKEIINYRKAISYIDMTKSKLTKEFILMINEVLLHDILSGDKIGKIRETDVYIISNKTHDIIMEPPPVEELEGAIDDLIEWYNTDNSSNPIIKAGILQYEITAIHPFIEGNGRTARLLSTWSLHTTGYKINKFFCLEEYYDKDTKGYYDALADADENGELTVWLEYFTKGLAYEFQKVQDKVLSISIDGLNKKKLGQISLSERQIKIINFIQEKGSLQNNDFTDIFPSISDDTILRDLADLIKKRVIKKSGKTRAARYYIK